MSVHRKKLCLPVVSSLNFRQWSKLFVIIFFIVCISQAGCVCMWMCAIKIVLNWSEIIPFKTFRSFFFFFFNEKRTNVYHLFCKSKKPIRVHYVCLMRCDFQNGKRSLLSTQIVFNMCTVHIGFYIFQNLQKYFYMRYLVEFSLCLIINICINNSWLLF